VPSNLFAFNNPSVACIVDCLLKSANVDDLPVEQATKFDLVINLNIAKALGVTIPSSLLAHLRLSFSRAASSGCNQWCRGQRSVSNFRAFKRSDLNLAAVHLPLLAQSGHDLVRKSAFAVAIGGKADMGLCTAHVCL
jgi:hypothetical protein